MKHTPEPWQYSRYSKPNGEPHTTSQDVADTLAFSALHSERAELFGANALSQEGEEITVFYTGNGPRAHLNAARAVACVNGCAGIANPEAIKDAVEALEELADYDSWSADDMRERARTALAKLKEGAQ